MRFFCHQKLKFFIIYISISFRIEFGINEERESLLCTFNRDPFCQLVDDIHSLILQHIKDVRCTEVSKKWNEIFRGSNEFMKNISLNLTDEKSTREWKNISKSIEGSTRKYININFDSPSHLKHLKKCTMIEMFSETLIQLKLGDICDESFVGDFKFPKLRTLVICHEGSRSIVKKVLENNESLKEIVEDSQLSISKSYAMEIGQFLMKKSNVEVLKLGRWLSHFLFADGALKNSEIQLKTLKIQEFISSQSLLKFLETQEKTLEEFSAKVVSVEVLKYLMENMNKLKKIELVAIYDSENFDENYSKENSTITEISIDNFPPPLFQKLTKLTTNLKSSRTNHVASLSREFQCSFNDISDIFPHLSLYPASKPI